MPFFYSQYLKDDKKAWAAREVSHCNNNSTPSSTKKPSQPSTKQSKASKKSSAATTSPSRLVWHSNVGSTHKPTAAKRGGFFSAFQYNDPTKKKTVHFATIEVQPYHWDYACDPDVYYKKEQITAMNKQRFTDASLLRKQRNIKVPSKKDTNEATAAKDDVDIDQRTSDIERLLTEAFDPTRDIDENVSIRGIEHFVYPSLQQEMIRRKKHAKREVLQFKKSKRPDPQGWRLARLSEANTLWAREVAIEKGMRYCMNQKEVYGLGECGISRDELERSKDELDNLHMLKSSASCVDTMTMSLSSTAVDDKGGIGGGVGLDGRRESRRADSLTLTRDEAKDICSLMENVKMAYSEDEEGGETSQSAGADTRED